MQFTRNLFLHAFHHQNEYPICSVQCTNCNFIMSYTLLVRSRIASEFVYICSGSKAADPGVDWTSCCLSPNACSPPCFTDTNKVFFLPTTAAAAFWIAVWKPWRWLCVETPVDQQQFFFRSGARSGSGNHIQSHFNPLYCSFWCQLWTSASHSHPVHIWNALSRCHAFGCLDDVLVSGVMIVSGFSTQFIC